jgi:hypothetical protein
MAWRRNSPYSLVTAHGRGAGSLFPDIGVTVKIQRAGHCFWDRPAAVNEDVEGLLVTTPRTTRAKRRRPDELGTTLKTADSTYG